MALEETPYMDVRERTDEVARSELQLRGQREILEMIDQGRDLSAIFTRICELIESQAKGMLTSILLVDQQRQCLLHGAAPNLPEDYSEAVDGITIGEGVGSCGHAAATGEPFAVSDISKHPNWSPFRGLAYEAHGLCACWSTPIKARDGTVVATFAMYHREVKSPSARDRKLADYSAHLVAIAIERAREHARLVTER